MRVTREGLADWELSPTSRIFDDDQADLEIRVRRLETDFAWAEQPPSRTRHLVTNVIVETPTDLEDVEEYSGDLQLLIYRSRGTIRTRVCIRCPQGPGATGHGRLAAGEAMGGVRPVADQRAQLVHLPLTIPADLVRRRRHGSRPSRAREAERPDGARAGRVPHRRRQRRPDRRRERVRGRGGPQVHTRNGCASTSGRRAGHPASARRGRPRLLELPGARSSSPSCWRGIRASDRGTGGPGDPR